MLGGRGQSNCKRAELAFEAVLIVKHFSSLTKH